MTITVATVISAVKRHLSIIGKRLYNKEGKNMFSDITLSSAEETQILTQYINASYYDVEGVLKQFITPDTTTPETGKIKFTIYNSRGETDFPARSQELIESYITLNSVGEYLSMMHPDIAQKYQRDAQQRIESLVEYVFYKKPYEEATAISQPTSSVTEYVPPSDSENQEEVVESQENP